MTQSIIAHVVMAKTSDSLCSGTLKFWSQGYQSLPRPVSRVSLECGPLMALVGVEPSPVPVRRRYSSQNSTHLVFPLDEEALEARGKRQRRTAT